MVIVLICLFATFHMCFAAHFEVGTYAFSKTGPSLARRSIFGVFTQSQSYAFPKCREASAAMMNKTFGLPACAEAAHHSNPMRDRAILFP